MIRRGYCSITVAIHDGTWLIRFVSKSYTHPWKGFANKFRLVLHACIRLLVKKISWFKPNSLCITWLIKALCGNRLQSTLRHRDQWRRLTWRWQTPLAHWFCIGVPFVETGGEIGPASVATFDETILSLMLSCHLPMHVFRLRLLQLTYMAAEIGSSHPGDLMERPCTRTGRFGRLF